MARENLKRRPRKRESIEARHRGGTARSSEEASVMEVERRGCVTRLSPLVNQKWEERSGESKIVRDSETTHLGSVPAYQE
jgi:hypothetical protein